MVTPTDTLMRPRPASRRVSVATPRGGRPSKNEAAASPRGDTLSIIMSPGQHHTARAPR